MATITTSEGTLDEIVVTPLLILNFGYERGSQNTIHEMLAGDYPTVNLRRARSRSGTLSMLFGSRALAKAAEDAFVLANRFHFEAPEADEDFEFVTAGRISVHNEPGTGFWVVDVEFREVG